MANTMTATALQSNVNKNFVGTIHNNKHKIDMCNGMRRDITFKRLHYNTTLTPSSKAIYPGTKYYDTHIEFHSLFLDVSSTDV